MPEPMQEEEEKKKPEVDDAIHGAWSRMWSSVSPQSPLLAWMDWASHLAVSPGKSAALSSLAFEQMARMHALARSAVNPQSDKIDLPPPSDRRFVDPTWRQWPFNLFSQSFEMQSQWWMEATSDVWGVDPHHRDIVGFGAKQWMEMCSPTNLAALNPLVIRKSCLLYTSPSPRDS